MNYKLINSKIPQDINLSVIERILTNRGIQLNDIPHYLNTTDNDIINPDQINYIKEGAKMLAQHISNNDLILVIVDSDADGMTSASVLINYLNRLFPFYIQNKIIYALHEGKEHGLVDMIPLIAQDKYKLIICPDSASSDYEQHEFLYNQGIDVLVIDHHHAPKVSEYACVINNQLDNYPTKSLSGVGMVYKFCQYFDEIMNVDYADDYLDLVSLGLIADVMDLRDFETKHLVNKGLENIQNPFIERMVEKNSYSLGDELTPIGMAFYIAPYVNATIRSGTLDEKYRLFEAMLNYKAMIEVPSTKRGCKGQMELLVEQAVRNCVNIKNRQTKDRDKITEIIEDIIIQNDLNKNKVLVICIPADIKVNKNLTGLIANQLMSKYGKPILLLNETINDQKQKCWAGSARVPNNVGIEDFRADLELSGLTQFAQGHSSAFGTAILDSDLLNFISYVNNKYQDYNFNPCYNVDFIFSASNFENSDIIKIAEFKSLWGQGVSEPYIAMENIKVTSNSLTLMSPDKNPTLKIVLPNGTSLIKFKSSNEEYQKLKTDGVIYLNAIGRCERNVWNGRISPQIIIEDYEISSKMDYYF